MPYGLYVHIPYCRSRCRYCDFYTAGASRGVPQAYINALLRSFAHHAPKKPDGTPQRPVSVYFGGGTPGLLSGAQVAALLTTFAPLPGAEITLETNPELAEPGILQSWRAAGVNRISFGVQTAKEESLQRLGRLHRAADAQAALQNAQKAGFENIAGDIMLALPGYTNEEFDQTLALLHQGGANHISAYLLKIEPGTPFGRQRPQNLPDEETAADFYLYAVQQLQRAGYAQYEISNFAKPGRAGRHNLLYWNCEDYLGLGPAAHSCLGGTRYSFAPSTDGFIKGTLPLEPQGACTAQDYIMLQLRLATGLVEAQLESRFGTALTNAQRALLQKLQKGGLATHTQGAWALTPRGFLVQNAILAQLLE